MAVLNLSLAAGQLVSPPVRLPFSYESWQGGGTISLLFYVPATGTVIGAGGINVQVSNDPNASPSGTTAQQSAARWNLHDVLQGLTASKNDNIGFPIAFLRLQGIVTSGIVYLDCGIADASPPVA